MTRLMVWTIVLALFATSPAAAQGSPDLWRGVAEKIEPGTQVRIELRDGREFTAILVAARAEAVVVQPKVRVTVPPQEVPYGEIVSLERKKGDGMGAAKAAAIGVATGVGAFFGIMLIMLSISMD